MRNIKELLELVLNRGVRMFGICEAVSYLRDTDAITEREQRIITTYMRKNIPVKTFFDCEGNPTGNRYQFWYKPGEKEQRHAWLREHIELNSKIQDL